MCTGTRYLAKNQVKCKRYLFVYLSIYPFSFSCFAAKHKNIDIKSTILYNYVYHLKVLHVQQKIKKKSETDNNNKTQQTQHTHTHTHHTMHPTANNLPIHIPTMIHFIFRRYPILIPYEIL